MANVNKVILIGNLTRDPELRYTPSGTAVIDLGMAMNRRYKGRDGEMKEDTCFVDLQAWARSAEVISEYCHKGDPLYVEGRLQLDSWEGRDGQKRSKLRVVVENFQLLGGRRGAGGAGGGGQQQRSSAPPPQQRQQPPPEPDAPPPPADGGFQVDDDIPF